MSSRDVRSPEFIARVRKAVQCFCAGRRMILSEEDLFQSTYLKYLEGGREHSTVEQVIIDVFRDEVGRKGSPSHEGRLALRGAVSFDAVENPDAIMPRTPDLRIDERLDLERALRIVDTKFEKLPRHRQAARMLWIEGMLHEEVATYFDVTFSLISQWEKKMVQAVRNEIKQPDPLLTVEEAAELIGVSFVTLHKAIREKKIRHVLNEKGKRRIKRSDAEAYKATVKTPAQKLRSVPTPPAIKTPSVFQKLAEQEEGKGGLAKQETLTVPHVRTKADLADRMKVRARELHQAGEYRTSSELLILLLDAA